MPAQADPAGGAPGAPLEHELVVCDDPGELSRAAAAFVVALAEGCVAERAAFDMAVSGGHTPWAMFADLRTMEVPWESVTIHQVDERFVPADDDDRNLAHLRSALAGAPAMVVPMPVGDDGDGDGDPGAAARRYEDQLPARFDLVHLGLGPDGHTASLVPGDGVLEVADRAVAVTTSAYQGHHRMTLTYPGLARAATILWLVSGASKADALARLFAGDPSIPAAGVRAGRSVVMADRAATADLPSGVLDRAGEPGP